MPVRLALVGLAGIGRQHLATVTALPSADVVAVCDTHAEALASITQATGIPGYSDLATLLDQARPDAVSLCTPPASHLPLTRLAAERGVHVLVEKPMAPSPADCQAMIEACRAAGVVLMVGQKKRYLPAVQRLRALLDNELGPVHMLLHRYPHPWFSDKPWFWREDDGGGPLLENAVHAADLLRYLGGDVVRVQAEASSALAERYAPQLNGACYTVRFAAGGIGCVGAGMVSLTGLNFEDVYVACEHGVAELSGRFDNADTVTWALRSAPNEVRTESFAGGDPFRLEFEHFLDCLATGAEPLSSGEEGLAAVRLCLAVKEAARSGLGVALEAAQVF